MILSANFNMSWSFATQSKASFFEHVFIVFHYRKSDNDDNHLLVPFRKSLLLVFVILAFLLCCEIGFPPLLWLWFKSNINHHNPILERNRHSGTPPPSPKSNASSKKPEKYWNVNTDSFKWVKGIKGWKNGFSHAKPCCQALESEWKAGWPQQGKAVKTTKWRHHRRMRGKAQKLFGYFSKGLSMQLLWLLATIKTEA